MAGGEGCADGVEAFDVLGVAIAFWFGFPGDFVFEAAEDVRAHVCHDAHVDDDVGAIGALDADFGEWGIERAHAEGDDVHGAAGHGSGEFLV